LGLCLAEGSADHSNGFLSLANRFKLGSFSGPRISFRLIFAEWTSLTQVSSATRQMLSGDPFLANAIPDHAGTKTKTKTRPRATLERRITSQCQGSGVQHVPSNRMGYDPNPTIPPNFPSSLSLFYSRTRTKFVWSIPSPLNPLPFHRHFDFTSRALAAL
jgi:hypothetical protein